MRHQASNSAEDRLLSITARIEERDTPLCPHFGACGGCQLQHIPYEQQVSAKAVMLIDVLHARGIANVPKVQVHTALPWRYRNRVRLRIQGQDIGYSRRESNDFLAIETCPIAAPLLERVALTLRDIVRSGKAAWPEGAAAFELFTDAEEQTLQMSIHLDATVATVEREAPQHFRQLCVALHGAIPQMAGAGLLVAAPDPQQSKRIQKTQRVEIARWGSPQTTYRVDGREYTISRNAFFQVNRFLTADMVRVVTGRQNGRLALDLFAGSGLFSVALAERFQQVIAVEIGEPAASDLRLHLAHAGDGHRAIHSTTDDFLRQPGITPDLVVLDPPRAGVSPMSLRRIPALHARQLVYVSCNAESFARDAKSLLESGYTIAALHLFDLFPQTIHTETIAVFRR